MVKEKLGLRDPSISAIYRNRGISMYDIDAVLINVKGEIAAILEYKHGNIREINRNNLQCLVNYKLANGVHAPFFIVCYHHFNGDKLLNANDYPSLKETNEIMDLISHKQYYVMAGNSHAIKWLNGDYLMMSEKQFWQFQADLTQNSHLDYSNFNNKIIDVNQPRIR